MKKNTKWILAGLALAAVAYWFWKRRTLDGVVDNSSDAAALALPSTTSAPGSTVVVNVPSGTTPPTTAADANHVALPGTTTTPTTTQPPATVNGILLSTLNTIAGPIWDRIQDQFSARGKILEEGTPAYKRAQKRVQAEALKTALAQERAAASATT